MVGKTVPHVGWQFVSWWIMGYLRLCAGFAGWQRGNGRDGGGTHPVWG